MQRALMQYWLPQNRPLVEKALRLCRREDLIGRGGRCLIPPNRPPMPENTAQKQDIMHLIAEAIIRSRYVIMLLFLAAAVYCGASLDKVKVSSDLTAFLPADTETRRGISIMEEEFASFASDRIMVGNVTWERARELADRIAGLDAVSSVTFDDTEAHYVNAAALLDVAYSGPDGDAAVAAAYAVR